MKWNTKKWISSVSLLSLIATQNAQAGLPGDRGAPIKVFLHTDNTPDITIEGEKNSIVGNIDLNSVKSDGFELFVPTIMGVKKDNSTGSITYNILNEEGFNVGSCTITVNGGTAKEDIEKEWGNKWPPGLLPIPTSISYSSSSSSVSSPSGKLYSCAEPTRSGTARTFNLSTAIYVSGLIGLQFTVFTLAAAIWKGRSEKKQNDLNNFFTEESHLIPEKAVDLDKEQGSHEDLLHKKMINLEGLSGEISTHVNPFISAFDVNALYEYAQQNIKPGVSTVNQALGMLKENAQVLAQAQNDMLNRFAYDILNTSFSNLEQGNNYHTQVYNNMADVFKTLGIQDVSTYETITKENVEAKFSGISNAQNLQGITDVNGNLKTTLPSGNLVLNNSTELKPIVLDDRISHVRRGMLVGAFGGILTMAFMALPFYAYFLVDANQAPSFDINVVKTQQKLVSKSANFLTTPLVVSRTTPGGDIMVTDVSIELGTPKGSVVLASKNKEDQNFTNPENYPVLSVLAGNPSAVAQSWYDETNKVSNIVAATKNGLQVLSFDSSGNYLGASETMFPGQEVKGVTLFQTGDEKESRSFGIIEVKSKTKDEVSGKEIVETKIYHTLTSAQSLTTASKQSDFVAVTQGAADIFGNTFYADEDNPQLRVMLKDTSTFVDPGFPNGTKVEKLVELAHGGLLFFTNNGLYLSADKGRVVPIPSNLIDASQYNSVRLVDVADKKDGEEKPAYFTVLFYNDDLAANKTTGMQVAKIPFDAALALPETWKVKKILNNEFAYSMHKGPAILTTLSEVKTVDSKDTFSGLKSYRLNSDTLELAEIVDVDYSPKKDSSDVYYTEANGDVTRVDRKTNSVVTLSKAAEDKFTKIHTLYKAQKMLVATPNSLKMMSESRPDLANAQEILKDINGEIKIIKSSIDKDGLEHILVGTTDGLFVIKQNSAGNYAAPLLVFEGIPIDKVDFLMSNGHAIIYSADIFPEGLRANVSVAAIEDEAAFGD